MTPSRMLRPALVTLIGLATSSCGGIENDPRRFESMAQFVADIPLGDAPRAVRTATDSGLRPAMVTAEMVADPGDLRVEVMDPHDLWDARDAGLRGAVAAAAPAMIEAAAPVVAEAVVRQVADRASEAPARTERAVVEPVARTTLQLGAFSSPAAAQAAWRRIASAGRTVGGLSPQFEAVQVDGRTLTRLKVMASDETARAVCRAADAAQLGCLRRG